MLVKQEDPLSAHRQTDFGRMEAIAQCLVEIKGEKGKAGDQPRPGGCQAAPRDANPARWQGPGNWQHEPRLALRVQIPLQDLLKYSSFRHHLPSPLGFSQALVLAHLHVFRQ